MDWAHEKALEIASKYANAPTTPTRVASLVEDIATALREERSESEARARTRENEKCRELIGARVGAT